jgi:hypothetical protein
VPIIRHDLIQPIEDYRRQHSAAPLDGPADAALGVDLRDIVALLRQSFVRLAFGISGTGILPKIAPADPVGGRLSNFVLGHDSVACCCDTTQVTTWQYLLLVLAASGILLLPLLHDEPPFSMFVSRIGEFANPFASGSMRFLGAYGMTGHILQGNPVSSIFRNGPGSVGHMKGLVDYEVLDTSWFKLLVEFGVIGVTSCFPPYLYVLFANSPDRLLSFACLAHSRLLGGFSNYFHAQFLYPALVRWPRVTAQAAKPSQYNDLDEWFATGPARAGGAQYVH